MPLLNGRCFAWYKRRMSKGIPILLADLSDLDKVARDVPVMALALMERFWPGPLTLVVPKSPALPASISANEGIAVRIPDNSIARALIRAAGGAVATSSANRSGHPPAETAAQALSEWNGKVTLVLDGGPATLGIASTVVDCTTPDIKILRPGPITARELSLSEFGLKRV